MGSFLAGSTLGGTGDGRSNGVGVGIELGARLEVIVSVSEVLTRTAWGRLWLVVGV